MTDTIEAILIEGEGISVSRLMWRRFHRPMPGLVEQTLSINPGLGDLGAYLPVGTIVNVPVPATRQREPDITPVRLWG